MKFLDVELRFLWAYGREGVDCDCDCERSDDGRRGCMDGWMDCKERVKVRLLLLPS